MKRTTGVAYTILDFSSASVPHSEEADGKLEEVCKCGAGVYHCVNGHMNGDRVASQTILHAGRALHNVRL